VYLPNGPGSIDSDHRGEVSIILQNGGRERFVVRRGDRIAQLAIAPVLQPVLEEVQTEADLGSTERGGFGFGHTGR
jgi:dUTP pyrophosphatase